MDSKVEEVKKLWGEDSFNSMVHSFRSDSQVKGRKMPRPTFHSAMKFCGVFGEYADAMYDYIWPWDTDYTKKGIFQTHRCTKCDDGRLPCIEPDHGCQFLQARND